MDQVAPIPQLDEQTVAAERIFLRPLTEQDIDGRYIAWFADPDVTQFIQSRNFGIEESRRYLRDGRASRSYFLYAICLKETGAHIGNLKIGPIIWPHLVSDLVTVIGQKDCWGKGLAAEAIALGSRLAVEVYGMRKLHGAILESNVGSIKAYTRAGWVVEGRLEGHYLVDGVPMDAILVSYFGKQRVT